MEETRGRPEIPEDQKKVTVAFTLTQEQKDMLDEKDNKSEYIRKLLDNGEKTIMEKEIMIREQMDVIEKLQRENDFLKGLFEDEKVTIDRNKVSEREVEKLHGL